MVLAMDFRRQAQVCARLAEDCEDQRLAERFRNGHRPVDQGGRLRSTAKRTGSAQRRRLARAFIAGAPELKPAVPAHASIAHR